MNLAKLIAPCKYVLNTDVLKFDITAIKNMAKYERDNVDQCNDMLEVILRAHYSDCKLSDFIGQTLCETDELSIYQRLVERIPRLIGTILPNWYIINAGEKRVHKNKRYSDFSANMEYHPNAESCKTPCAYKSRNRSGIFYLVINDLEHNDAIIVLGEISEWQAHYISIFNVICSLGKDADVVGNEHQLYKIFMDKITVNDTKTTDVVKDAQLTGGSNKQLDNTAQVKDVQPTKVTDTAQVKDVQPTKVTDTQLENTAQVKDMLNQPYVAAELENYKLLLGKNSNNWFEPAQKEAKLKSVCGDYIAVEIGTNVLVFNTGHKYFCPRKQSATDLSKYCIDDVKCVTIKGNENNFAHPGFVYDNVTYKITGLSYWHLYSYIVFGRDTMNMIPKDLIELTNKIKTDVENLPETEFCQDAKVTCGKDYIKITHGPLVIYTYLEFKCQFIDKGKYKPEKRNYIKSRMFAGKNKNKYYVFLQVGKQTYKYTGIGNLTAGEILMHRRLADSK